MNTPRPIKSGGYDNYQQEVSAGISDIIDAELDGDIGTLYDLVNGGLDDFNIAAAANIDYSKLNLHGRIQDGDIVAVSGSKIIGTTLPGGSIAPGTVTGGPGGQLAPATVAFTNMALFASCIAGTPVAVGRTNSFALDMGVNDTPGAELVLNSINWTTRGGPFFLFAELMVEVLGDPQNAHDLMQASFWMRVRDDQNTGDPLAGTVLLTRTARVTGNAGPPALGVFGQSIIPITFSVPSWGSFVLGGGSGVKRWTQTIQVGVGSTVRPLQVNHTVSNLTGMELA